MKSPAQRRGITSKKKALSGIVHKLKDGSQRRSRKNDWLNVRSQDQIEYANVEKSARDQRKTGLNNFSSLRDYEPSYDRYDDDVRNQDQQESSRRQYERDVISQSGERNHERRLRQNYTSIYGEHPASRGRVEYLRSNKRRPGLLGNQHYERNGSYNKPYQEYSEEKDKRKERHRINHKNNARLAYKDYMNRGQFERQFHGREIYDPIELEYELMRQEDRARRNHLYRYEGYQTYGHIEGFGISDGKHHGQDWTEEDEYRHGHARRKIGRGKFGSR